jgi:hypothetical protein
MMLQEVVQEYRFERRQVSSSNMARVAASWIVEKADASIRDSMTYASVLIEWTKREHRDWFWRCRETITSCERVPRRALAFVQAAPPLLSVPASPWSRVVRQSRREAQ